MHRTWMMRRCVASSLPYTLPPPTTPPQGGYLTYRTWMMRTRWSWHVKEELRKGARAQQYQAVLDALNVLGGTAW